LANPNGWAHSEVERVRELILEEFDALLQSPAESREEATREALSRLEPHLKGALKALETLERVRGLTEEELARRAAFVSLLDLAGRPGHE
jgi:hypothetical protein